MAYVLYEPNVPQEHAQNAHGSGARVQDHDPETSQPAQTTAQWSHWHRSWLLQNRYRVSQPHNGEHLVVVLMRCWKNDTLVAPFGKEDAAAESQSHAARTQETLVNAVEKKSPKSFAQCFAHLTRLKSYRDEGIQHDCPIWNAVHKREQRDLPTRNRVTRVQDSACCRRA